MMRRKNQKNLKKNLKRKTHLPRLFSRRIARPPFSLAA